MWKKCTASEQTTIECKTLIQGLKLVSPMERRSVERLISRQTTIWTLNDGEFLFKGKRVHREGAFLCRDFFSPIYLGLKL